MEESDQSEPENFAGLPHEMDKSVFELLRFTHQEESEEEERSILMFCDNVKPCSKCGNQHIELFQFFYHYN